ncbi:uncharacterized protein N7483_000483 [Penicillium malachiteum]|uniref:uncharacterized protein n=1 Tax=Penicillium malachiteum TaxID=1324776 RepID=UPI00254913F7|nr:uncharacterized protein N7483_000483 [Penicillium malachiteum]KAJ5735358.1 hypothetical protein N7483_000483 [Penicillium malachiteum]
MKVLAKLDGPGSKTQKSDWYDFLLPHVGVTTTRNQSFHDQRRRLWMKRVSTGAMARYEEQIKSHAKELDYWHYAIRDMRRAMRILGPLSPVPWLARIGFWALHGYWVIKDWHTMISFCAEQMKEKFLEPDSNDLAQAIIDEAKQKAHGDEHPALIADSVVAIVAGSDTVAPTLVFIFYELALNPEKAEKLYEEVRDFDLESNVSQELWLSPRCYYRNSASTPSCSHRWIS